MEVVVQEGIHTVLPLWGEEEGTAATGGNHREECRDRQ